MSVGKSITKCLLASCKSARLAGCKSARLAGCKSALLVGCACLTAISTSSRADEIDFQRDIAPILEERCWYCHGEDEQESGLRLDLRAHMIRGGDSGVSAVVPGKPEQSYLVEVINHVDKERAMPPDEDKLPAKEIELLTRWIQEGADWPGQMSEVAEEKSDHWSFQPVQRPEVPARKARTPIDAFLLDALAQQQMTFSQPADPRTLIRRVSIVLTGLTPSPEETNAFVKAYSQDAEAAYAALVDRLLDSPHFGERWAQHWLDVIRWAETNGSEANLYRKNAWIYRDYVVRAFNEDKPYDQFVREQIAGDSLGAGEATGFLVAGPHVPAATVGREPSAIRQARADRMDEVMQTVGASIMGVTIGCARCHNHKFDPITIRDYYAMTGVFQDIEFGSRYPELSPEHPRRQRGDALWREIAAQRRILRPTGPWIEDWGAYREAHFKPTKTEAVRIVFQSNNVALDEIQIFGPEQPRENLVHPRRGTRLSGFPEKGVDGRNPITRVNDGDFGTMAWRARVEKNDKQRPWVRFDFDQPQTIHRVRLSTNREYFFDTDYLTTKPRLAFQEFQIERLTEDGQWKPLAGSWWIKNELNKKQPKRAAAVKSISGLIDQLAEEGPRPSFIGRLVRPRVTRVLLRGSPESPRDEVAPAGPAIFDGDLSLTSADSGSKRRAEFANWITRPDNPLTARVMVNRIWHHVFGSGIVTTTSDFGQAGARPTHAELLDWMAAEFVKPAATDSPSWSMKSMIRQLVMSDAFRQSSEPTVAGMEKDASTKLLWRFPPKRVEAEVIRDSILQASGALDRTVGGRSYRIHNIKKTYAQWEVVDNHGADTWRRMLYQERMRRVDDGMFTAFDFPDCGQVRAKRPVSTTPLQALNLMNSDFVMTQSKLIAERALKESDGATGNAIDRCFVLLLGRSPDEQERQACRQLVRENDLSLVCRALINSNEFAFLP